MHWSKYILSFIILLSICAIDCAGQQYYPVRQQGKWGYMDSTGKITAKPMYDSTFDYKGNFARALLNGKMIIINPKNNQIVLQASNDYTQLSNDMFAYKSDKLWGIKTIEGEILPAEYKTIVDLGMGFYKISKDGKLFGIFCMALKKIIIPEEYHDFEILGGGFIGAKKNKNDWVLADKEGTIIIEKKIRLVDIYTDMLILNDKDKKKYLYNIKLKKLLDLPFDKLADDLNNAMILKDDKYLIVYNKENGSYRKLSNITNITPLSERFYLFEGKERQGVLTSDFDTLIPLTYNYISYIDGRFKVMDENNKNGIVDTTNKIIIPVKYDWILGYENIYYIVTSDSFFGVYNWKGKNIIPVKYKKINNYKTSLKCFYDNSVYIYELDSTAKIVSKNSFNQVTEITGVTAIEADSSLNKYGTDILANPWINRPGFVNNAQVVRFNQPQFVNNIQAGQNGGMVVAQEKKQARWVPGDRSLYKYVSERDSVIIPPKYMYVRQIDSTLYTIYGNIGPKKKKIMGIYLDPSNYYYGIVNHNTGIEIFKAIYLWIDSKMLAATRGKYTRAITQDMHYVILYTDGKIYKDNYIYMSQTSNGRIKAYKGGEIILSNNTGRSINLIPRSSIFEYYQELGKGINSRLYDKIQNDYKIPNYINYTGGVWVYIDSLTNVIISDSLEYICPFEQNSAIVRKNGYWGVIDTNGNWLIQPQYYAIKPEYSNGLLNYRLINRLENDEENTTQQGDAIAIVKRGEKYTFVRNDGSLVTDSLLEEVMPFDNGYASVRRKDKFPDVEHKGKYYYKDSWYILTEDGEFKGEFESKDMSSVGDGLIPFCYNRNGGNMYAQYPKLYFGFKNLSNDTIIPPLYKRVGKFVNGLCNVKTDSNRWGYINKEGMVVISPIFLSAKPFNANGFARVYNSNSEVLYIDQKGKELKYKPIDETSTNTYQVLKHLSKNIYRIYDKEGKLINTYKKCVKMSTFSDGYALREKKHWLWGYTIFSYIDSTGEIKANYRKYNWMTSYADGYAIASRTYKSIYYKDESVNGGRGTKTVRVVRDTTINIMLDKEGNEVPLLFYPERKFKPSNGVILGFKERRNHEQKLYTINSEPLSETVITFANPFEFGVSRVRLVSGKWALMNTKGEIITQTTFDEIKPFRPAGEANQKLVYGLADSKGSIILDPIYSHIKVYGNSVIKVEGYNQLGYINAEGKWIWGMQ